MKIPSFNSLFMGLSVYSKTLMRLGHLSGPDGFQPLPQACTSHPPRRPVPWFLLDFRCVSGLEGPGLADGSEEGFKDVVSPPPSLVSHTPTSEISEVSVYAVSREELPLATGSQILRDYTEISVDALPVSGD